VNRTGRQGCKRSSFCCSRAGAAIDVGCSRLVFGLRAGWRRSAGRVVLVEGGDGVAEADGGACSEAG
jgi:hypothetical protein